MLAFGSMLLSLVRTIEFPARHATLIAVLLIIFRFPWAIEYGFRNSYSGISHGSEATPSIVIQLTAVAVMAVFLVVHHLLI